MELVIKIRKWCLGCDDYVTPDKDEKGIFCPVCGSNSSQLLEIGSEELPKRDDKSEG